MRRTFGGFALGFLAGVLTLVVTLKHSERRVQGAWIVREDPASATIRFNHDATDQVVCVRVPIPEFPSSKGHQGHATTTVTIWSESDSVTETLMQTNAFEVEANVVRDLLGQWQHGQAAPR